MTRTRFLTALKAALVAATVSAVAVGGLASALPNREITWEWYSDATYQDMVGGRVISCSGNGGRWGVVTEYDIVSYGDPCEREPPPKW